ncbi:MAG: hypothetical protein HP494_03175 [Nitrospira sp.]|nr:hypothetical protein [Nitrospira sp.]
MSEEARRTLRYVEPLSDARTPLGDFFSILLETIQVIVSALAEEDYALAQTIPIKDLKRILPSFNNLLKVCVACHLEYTVSDCS